MKYTWLILLFYYFPRARSQHDGRLLDLLVDVLKDTNERIGHLSNIKQACEGRAAFEVGYVMYTLQDKYRRMVDKYHVMVFMKKRYFVVEFILLLEEVELHYWDIEHIMNMLHEIERKYTLDSDLEADYVIPTTTSTTAATRPFLTWKSRSRTKKKKRHFDQYKFLADKLFGTTATKKTSWWPIEYGWEIDYWW